MSGKSAYQRWHEWRLRVVSDSNQHENMKQRQREQKRKERAKFKEKASNAQLEAKRAADRERQRRRRARLRAAKELETATGVVTAPRACRTPRVVPQVNSSRAHSHSKATRPSMKISVNGLISAKKGHRSLDGSTVSKELHTLNNLNGHSSPTLGRMDAKSDVFPRSPQVVDTKSPLVMDTKITNDLYMAKNNNSYLPSFFPSPAPKVQELPEQDQPLCLKKTVPRLTKVVHVDRDIKRTLISPSDQLKKPHSCSQNSCNTPIPSSRKRSRKQEAPLKYVALHQNQYS